MICKECETVAHCTNYGCIPKQQALDKMADNARELRLDYEVPKQPEALRLADALRDGIYLLSVERDATEATLRRLHQSETEGWRYAAELEQERKRLHEVNQELLEALKVLADESDGFNVSGVYFNEKCMGHKGLDMARAAITKAGKQP